MGRVTKSSRFCIFILFMLLCSIAVLGAPSVKETVLDPVSYPSSASNDRPYGYLIKVNTNFTLYTVQKNASHNPTDAGKLNVLNLNTSVSHSVAWTGDNATFGTPIEMVKGQWYSIFENETGSRTLVYQPDGLAAHINRTYAYYWFACYGDVGVGWCDDRLTTANANGVVQMLYIEPPASPDYFPQWANNGTNATTPTYLGSWVQAFVNISDEDAIGNTIWSVNGSGVWVNDTMYEGVGLSALNLSFDYKIPRSPGDKVIAYKLFFNDTANQFNVTPEWLWYVTDRFPTQYISPTNGVNFVFNNSLAGTPKINTTTLYVNEILGGYQYFTDDGNLSTYNMTWYNSTHIIATFSGASVCSPGLGCDYRKNNDVITGINVTHSGDWSVKVCQNDTSDQWTCGVLWNFTVLGAPPEYDGYGISQCQYWGGAWSCPTPVAGSDMYYKQYAVIYSNWTVPAGELYQFKLYETLPNGTPYCNFSISHAGCNWTNFNCTDPTDCNVDVYSYATMSPAGTHVFSFVANTTLGGLNTTPEFNVTLISDGGPVVSQRELHIYGEDSIWQVYDVTGISDTHYVSEWQPYYFELNGTSFNGFGDYPYNLSAWRQTNYSGTMLNTTMDIHTAGYQAISDDFILYDFMWGGAGGTGYALEGDIYYKFYLNSSLSDWVASDSTIIRVVGNYPWYESSSANNSGSIPFNTPVYFDTDYRNYFVNLSCFNFVWEDTGVTGALINTTKCMDDVGGDIAITCVTNYTNCTASITWTYAYVPWAPATTRWRWGANNSVIGKWNYTDWTTIETVNSKPVWADPRIQLQNLTYRRVNGTKLDYSDWSLLTVVMVNWSTAYGNLTNYTIQYTTPNGTIINKSQNIELNNWWCVDEYNTSCVAYWKPNLLDAWQPGVWTWKMFMNTSQDEWNTTPLYAFEFKDYDGASELKNFSVTPCYTTSTGKVAWKNGTMVNFTLFVNNTDPDYYPTRPDSVSANILFVNATDNSTYCQTGWTGQVTALEPMFLNITNCLNFTTQMYLVIQTNDSGNGTVINWSDTLNVSIYGRESGQCYTYYPYTITPPAPANETGSGLASYFDYSQGVANLPGNLFWVVLMLALVVAIWFPLQGYKSPQMAFVGTLVGLVAMNFLGYYMGFLNGGAFFIIFIICIIAGVLGGKMVFGNGR